MLRPASLCADEAGWAACLWPLNTASDGGPFGTYDDAGKVFAFSILQADQPERLRHGSDPLNHSLE